MASELRQLTPFKRDMDTGLLKAGYRALGSFKRELHSAKAGLQSLPPRRLRSGHVDEALRAKLLSAQRRGSFKGVMGTIWYRVYRTW